MDSTNGINGINQPESGCITPTQGNIIYNLRVFRREMVYWARVFFNSVFADIGSADDVFTRLYYVPTGYAQTLRFIMDRRDAETFEQQYQQYIVQLRELIMSALRGDATGVETSISRIRANIKARSEFMASAFPDLDKEVLEEMLWTITQYEIEEINAYITQDYSRIIEIYDNLIEQSDRTADYMASGMIKLINAAPVPGSAADRRNEAPTVCVTPEDLDIILKMALFWVDIVTWYRAYRVSIMAGIGKGEVLLDRVIRKTEEFGELLRLFVDEEVANTQVKLLQEYLLLMDRHLRARMDGNVEEMNRLYKLAVDNIEERAAFYAEAFPGLDADAWRNQLLKLHSTLIEMGGEFLAGNFTRNIQIFDALVNQAEDMGIEFLSALIATDPL
ncbi:hypothetical protein MASR2M70_03800 [Bacillota bacterium]